ncbi:MULTISPECIES: O-methyltransferase [unclassified Pseudomonas]|uniref:O-methyltransferase n=1 Tax=unclassified Pseudomonas TaxID=196821 RepID=UPI000C8697D8|nr:MULTISPECIES: class I SAM-dependent methyltransferase [unclassified Pseudomonas]PMV17768.1 methyltransferase [Pseudomonas sp. FW305-3-2-15-C-TSA2]PMV19154.1 methyltransferase [Pseudomonas sp. DP16D-L5]PMV37886.1 methyltransferase [Pseudomonas sp. FW305-3-2-15-A-LB2]PMV42882.1 methyltransferase [Pseudomonas sp. FW305-3-2-15-C-LB1]PMV44289.1 methyltransferase [Pseudomonas sp. FW305-3-2-15-C-R2A1]
MSSLTTAPLAPLIERLYTQASAATSPLVNSLSKEERDRLMRSKTEYVALYSLLKDLWLPVSRDTGKLLYLLARSSKARAIVEFGTSFGLSTLHLAAALRDNGGGVLIGSEFEASKIALAREHFIEGGVSDLIHIREGDALVTLASDLPDSVDLLLLDGAKTLYGDVLGLVEKHLRPGALVVADNTDYCPEYLAHVRAPENGYVSVPFADDIELSIRLSAC